MWDILSIYVCIWHACLKNKIYVTCVLTDIGKSLKQLFTLEAKSSMRKMHHLSFPHIQAFMKYSHGQRWN